MMTPDPESKREQEDWLSQQACRKALEQELFTLAIKHDCDKAIDHKYIEFYADVLQPLKHRPGVLLEIGVGGYGRPQLGGASARMFAEFLPRCSVVVCDVEQKNLNLPPNVILRKGDQRDQSFIKELCSCYGPFDVIIDDGSHRPVDIEVTFYGLFPFLDQNGIYVIEDTQTSYLEKYGGGVGADSHNTFDLVRRFIDNINSAELPYRGQYKSILDQRLYKLEVMHNMVAVRKRVDSARLSNLDAVGRAAMLQTIVELERIYGSTYGKYWARRARMEVALGRIEDASKSIELGLKLTPDDQQLLCLREDIDGRSRA